MSILIRIMLFSLLCSNIYSQTNEVEPNDTPTSSGVQTLDLGIFNGSVSESVETTDIDYWTVPFGASSIDFNFINSSSLVEFILYSSNTSDYSELGFHASAFGGENPDSWLLNPIIYYTLRVDHIGPGSTSYEFDVENGILPVEIISIKAEIFNYCPLIYWKTAAEINNYGFEIERTTDYKGNASFEKIGFVEGHGNSNSTKEYKYVDSEIDQSGAKIQYRLKQIDSDGSYKYSEIVEVNLLENLPTKFELSQNYPNPFNPATTIRYSIPVAALSGVEAQHVTLKVYDILGREVTTLVNENQKAGNYEVTFNGIDFASGVYFYRLQTSTGFVSTKKLILMK